MSPLGCTATPVGRWSCPGDRPRMPKRLLNCPSLENIYAMNLYSLESELAQKSTEQEKAFVKYTVHQNMPVLFKETPHTHTHARVCVRTHAHMYTQENKIKTNKNKSLLSFLPHTIYLDSHTEKHTPISSQHKQSEEHTESYTCTHWLLLSAINIFPLVDAATP